MELSKGPKLVEAPSTFRSKIWKYFGFPVSDCGVSDKSKTVCKLCFTNIGYKTGSTTNMTTHLTRKHGINPQFEDSQNTEIDEKDKYMVKKVTNLTKSKTTTVSGQLRLAESFKSKLTRGSMRSQKIDNAIAVFIAKDLRPFSIVGNEVFRCLLNVLEPRYIPPSRPYIADNILPKLFNQVKSQVSEEVKKVDSIALTTDSWTSRATQSYTTITAHFIDSDWQIKNYFTDQNNE